MATINHRLQKISADLFISHGSREREDIEQKIRNFRASIKAHFGSDVDEVIVFGSYKRDTILPRGFDENSDIDILVVFNQEEDEFAPETYRNQLKKFAKLKYSKTTIVKDHPSVVLEMSKIKFDLVPCILDEGFFSDDYQIPDKYGDWMDTDPDGFNEDLTDANTKYDSIVKPIIRLLKRWNAYNSYPYDSFELEQIIADMNFSGDNYESGFLYAIDKLPTYDLPEYQVKKVETLNNNRTWIMEYLDRDNQEKAFEVLGRILGLAV